MPQIINKQRKIKLNKTELENFLHQIKTNITKNKDFCVVFVSDRQIKELNRRFRKKNYPTDVLSFSYDETDLLGDIVISLETAQKQAIENDLPFEVEIKQLILHGVLHLCGYDHETDNGEMNRLELKLRKKLQIER
ncbi:MAG: rRNA maturation RNase YbeY [Pyrinomonadaceae bacterium]|nr:rRNA maturation RNase YbeY [Pyrinomonadaceae bacterium]MCX7639748.1 rRNA maturation RNase YbeY [Pyrinomonadaceae bacterium]MDW8304331.1 rRNA maturation RNase YbeY [Acidobacteriota bacterium]